VSERIERYLDGEIGIEDLGPEELREARAWEAMFAEFRAREPVRAPAGLGDRVMAELGLAEPAPPPEPRAEPETPGAPAPTADGGSVRHGARRVWHAATWPFRPIRVPVPPALALAAGAALALVLFVWRSGAFPIGSRAGSSLIEPASVTTASPPPAAAPPRVYVELRLNAPNAHSVAVAGDFTNWKPTIQLQDPDGDGVWSGLVPMGPGVHQYMFVVNGTRWVTDPGAERHVDDGFGHRNAVVAVAAPAGA